MVSIVISRPGEGAAAVEAAGEVGRQPAEAAVRVYLQTTYTGANSTAMNVRNATPL
jgi:hypothetical protein